MREITLPSEREGDFAEYDHEHQDHEIAEPPPRRDRPVHYPRPAPERLETDCTQRYLAEIGGKPLLTREQEVQYSRRARRGEYFAWQRMVEGNLRLVVKIANRYQRLGLAFGDLIEEGNLGLLRAVDKFDPERGFRFSTYAAWWIRHKIENGINRNARSIRLPVHIIRELSRYRRAERELTARCFRAPSLEDIADLTGKPVKRVKMVMSLASEVYSVDAPIFRNTGASLREMIPDRDVEGPALRCGRERLRARVAEWLIELSPRQRDVLRRRFGFDGHDGDTFESIGLQIGLTRERTRQVQLEAIRKLKRIAARQGLDASVLDEFC